MYELLTVDDVERYTKGRLTAADAETQRLFDSALASVRRWCGWHVAPLTEMVLTLDGPGSSVLALPTLNVVALLAVSENGVPLDVSALEVSRRGLVRKRDRSLWTDTYGGIQVRLQHGFDPCPEFYSAVLAAVDDSSLSSGRGGLVRKRIDDVEYQWGGGSSGGAGGSSGGADWLPTGELEQFRLEPCP